MNLYGKEKVVRVRITAQELHQELRTDVSLRMINMITVLPQLPCENRYTADWIQVWRRELRKLDVSFQMVDPHNPYFPLAKVTKYFTDPYKALEYECAQIQALTVIKPDKILCLDVEFPGLMTPAIQLLRLTNPKLKACGYLHAGCWCDGDVWSRTKGRPWIDRMIFDTYDKVFVATYYHTKKIEDYFGRKFNNLVVVGFPFYQEDVVAYAKPIPFEEKKGILISGRLEQSNSRLIDTIKQKFTDVSVLQASSRKEYYKLLNKAKVILSLKTEETFGIGQLEAYVLHSIPLCPNQFAYPEVVGDERLLYSSEDDLVDKLTRLMELKFNPFYIDIKQYESTIKRCVEYMGELDES